MCGSGRSGGRAPSLAVAVLTLSLGTGRAVAQSRATTSSTPAPRNLGSERDTGSSETIYRVFRDAFTSVTGNTRGKLLDFFETIELWDVEAEVDRLVGNPWELHDSTEYKLRLLPLRLAYPFYGQLTDQMTGLDDRRGLRIQNLGVEEVDEMAVVFHPAQDVQLQDFLGALLGSLSVREFADLGVFMLAHQPFFPDSDKGWAHVKRRMADGKVPLAAGVLSVGAAFNVGAFSTSGTIASDARSGFGLGWYGGIRHVGMELQPQLRGGVTARAPGLEMAAGVREQIRPDDTDRRRSVEVAVREGWLSRLSRPSGWDAFVEGALRQVIASEPLYQGEQTTGRLGIFARRDASSRLHHLVFRTSGELESDMRSTARFVIGVGFDHPRSGLATLVQSSRTTVINNGVPTRDARVGLFVAGTVEPPTAFVLDAMHASARAVREVWQRLEIDADREENLAALAAALASYLESRRVAYSVLRWERPPGDVYGPLDGAVLADARRLVSAHFSLLASTLEDLSGRMAAGEQRADQIRDVLQHHDDDRAVTDGYRAELAALERIRKHEAERARAALTAYLHFRQALARIGTANPASAVGQLDPVPAPRMRRLVALSAPPLP
jgi:hypothetical protein